MNSKNVLTPVEQQTFLNTLKARFEENLHRHPTIQWLKVKDKLTAKPEKLCSLFQMEQTGGEPDVVGEASSGGELQFFDCSKETPIGRRSFCYDQEALETRSKNKPAGSAFGVAESMGIELLTEAQYRYLQTLGEFDLKTSSWIKTPENIRKLGGALFADRRYDTVFVYHNGAESYYASRGFRGVVSI